MVFPVEGEASVRGSGLCNRQRQGKGTCGGGRVGLFFFFFFFRYFFFLRLSFSGQTEAGDATEKTTATANSVRPVGRNRHRGVWETKAEASPRYF